MCGQGFIHNELVTTGLFGIGNHVVITSNYCGNLYSTFWIGNISGDKFSPYENATGDGPIGGVVDYGPICLVRTMGGDPTNQVTTPGRRVMIGQLRPFPVDDPPTAPHRLSSQSLARDITLSDDSPPELLQQFVPEFKTLRRVSGSSKAKDGSVVVEGQQFEIYASFSWSGSTPQQHFGLCLNGPAASCAALVVSCEGQDCQVQARESYNALDTGSNRKMLELGWTGSQAVAKSAWGGAATNVTGPMPAIALRNKQVRVHCIGDGNILEVIWENRTSTTLYYTPSAANSTLRVFAGGTEATVAAWRLAAPAVPAGLSVTVE